ncbi:MAG: hypothetical protein FJ317_04310 [SAR202 cluster bacterium]|nr:hypothetical protein [SAR202 cluster bacterium]
MDISFERGSSDKPKGHALLYFVDSANREDVWATYLIILPIEVEVSKYVPPFLMNQLGEAGPRGLSAFAFPPAPEKMQSKAQMDAMAELRDDDLFGGVLNASDVSGAMYAVNDAIQKYADQYAQAAKAALPAVNEDGNGSGPSVNEVLYGLMSDGDKLGELTKLIGRLRFAVEGAERNTIKDTEEEITLLARHLPDHHHIAKLVKAAKGSGTKSTRLAELYLQRSYYLIHQSFSKLTQLEKEISDLEAEDIAR